MCGIAGCLALGADTRADAEGVVRLRDAQAHRGPDDSGLWIAPDQWAVLGHRRLSIVDLTAAGHQPMGTADGHLWVTFNGEIYNHRELRAELELLGAKFESNCDTELLLHGWRAYGPALLDKLNGMFAFVLVDSIKGEAFLARDPLGIKPLYTAEVGGKLYFSSEIQPLRRELGLNEPDPEGVASFLQWGSIAAPRTLYAGIRALPAATWMQVRRGRIDGPNSYWSLEQELLSSDPLELVDAQEWARAALTQSVRKHSQADVEVGAFLSGGVDSAALVGLLSESHNGPVRTITLGFDDPKLDESDLAQRAAKLYGSSHQSVPIRISAMREGLQEAVQALDQPTIDGINVYFVSKAAAAAGLKVVVSGIGGDELFGGYKSFERVPRIRGIHQALNRVPVLTGLARPGAALLRSMPENRRTEKFAMALESGHSSAGAYYAEKGLFSPGRTRKLLAPEWAQAVSATDPARELQSRIDIDSVPDEERVSLMELRQYLEVQLLRDADAASMRHSIELRTPLVDRELLKALFRLSAAERRAGPAKKLLREAPKPPVPDALWKRRKQGFTLPIEGWLQEGSLSAQLPDHPLLRQSEMQRVAKDFRRGRVHWSRLWALHSLGSFLTR